MTFIKQFLAINLSSYRPEYTGKIWTWINPSPFHPQLAGNPKLPPAQRIQEMAPVMAVLWSQYPDRKNHWTRGEVEDFLTMLFETDLGAFRWVVDQTFKPIVSVWRRQRRS